MSVPSVGAPAPAAFQAIATWGEALRLMLRHWAMLLGQIAILCGLTFLVGLVVGILFGLTGGTPARAGIVGQALGTIVGFALSVNICMGVSRLAAQNETPRIGAIFHWGSRQWRLLGVSLLCLAIVFAPFLAIFLLRPGPDAVEMGTAGFASAGFFAGMLLWLVWAVVAAAKLGMITPIIANDGPPGAIRQSWNLARGHTARLAGGILLVVFALVVAELVVMVPGFVLGAQEGGLYVGIVQAVGGSVGGIWMTAFFSLAWLKLRGRAAA